MAFKLIKKEVTPPYYEVFKGYVPTADEKLVYRDEKTGTLYAKKPGFSLKSKKWKYLVVDSGIAVHKRGYNRQLESLDGTLSIGLKINYNFRLLTDIDLRFLQGMMGSSAADTFFESKLERWINDFLRKNPDFLSVFYKDKQRLVQFLKDTARTHGLHLEIALSENGNTKEHDEISGKIDLRTSDYYGRIALQYAIDCEIDEEHIPRGKLSLSRKDILRREIKKEIRSTIEDIGNLKLHTLYFDINKSIRANIETALEKYLSKKGLLLTFIHLKIDLPNVPLFRERFDYTVEGKTKNTYPLSVKHAIILTLDDLGKYYSSGITDVIPWVKKEMNRITQDYIFDHSFTELVTDFKDQWIRDEMRKILETVGYGIKQLITIPNLEKVVPDTVTIEIGENIEFETQRNDVKVKIGVQIDGKVRNLEKLKDILHPKKTVKDIVALITKAVVHEIRLTVHAMEPQHFYMHFDHADTDTGEASVHDQITQRITKLLENLYGIHINTFICKSLETDLVRQFRKIHMRTKTVHIESKSGEIKETARFDVLSVSKNGWHLFKAKCDTLDQQDPKAILDDISHRIKDFVETQLDEFRFDFVAVKSPEFRTRFLEFLRAAKGFIHEDFGLAIRFSQSIARGMTSIEIAMKEERAKELKHKLQKNEILRSAELEKLQTMTTSEIEQLKALGEEELSELQDGYYSSKQLRKKKEELRKESSRENVEMGHKNLEAGEITKKDRLRTPKKDKSEKSKKSIKKTNKK